MARGGLAIFGLRCIELLSWLVLLILRTDMKIKFVLVSDIEENIVRIMLSL